MFVKLLNGQSINLDDIDKLEGSNVSGLAKFFDGLKLRGNNNNVFDKQEIEKFKKFLIEAAGDDKQITNQEFKNVASKYGSIFDNYSENNFQDDLSMLSASLDSLNNTSVYKVKSGDTVDKIVANLGYKGEDFQIYKKALMSKLAENNSFMNDKSWLKVGSMIELLTDEEIKNLNIKKPTISNNSSQNSSGIKSATQNDSYYKVESGDKNIKIGAYFPYKVTLFYVFITFIMSVVGPVRYIKYEYKY